jgi:hypothetical protein
MELIKTRMADVLSGFARPRLGDAERHTTVAEQSVKKADGARARRGFLVRVQVVISRAASGRR